MRGDRGPVLLCALLVASCGMAGGPGGSGTVAGSAGAGEPLVIAPRVLVADREQTEPIATGEVLAGSTLGGSPFCPGGTVLDSHGSTDPAIRLIIETITCPDGTLSLAFTPFELNGQTQAGAWMIVKGTGAYDGLTGSGTLEAVYDPDPAAPTNVTFTGTARR